MLNQFNGLKTNQQPVAFTTPTLQITVATQFEYNNVVNILSLHLNKTAAFSSNIGCRECTIAEKNSHAKCFRPVPLKLLARRYLLSFEY